MRSHLAVTLGIAALGLVACETRTTDPMIAGIGGGGVPVSASALSISPNQVSLTVGATTQLSTNAGSGQQGQLQWTTSNSTVATVSSTGLVTAFLPGTATIGARLLSDTNQVATATILVTR